MTTEAVIQFPSKFYINSCIICHTYILYVRVIPAFIEIICKVYMYSCFHIIVCSYVFIKSALALLIDYLRVASSIGKTPIEKVVGGVRVNTIICRKCHTVNG